MFAELKKKYKHAVYKHRIALAEHGATDWLIGGNKLLENSLKVRPVLRFLGFFRFKRAFYPSDLFAV